MLFRLSLEQAITYEEGDYSFRDIDNAEAGSDLCFCFRYRYDDVFLNLEKLWSGLRTPFTDEEKKLIEAGFPAPERAGYGLQLPQGNYQMLQTIPAGTIQELKPVLASSLATRLEGLLYVRFFKENDFETVMQIFSPA